MIGRVLGRRGDAVRPSLLFHPERYHGHGRRPSFFEGWYFKLVDASKRHRFAVIPGIFLSDDPADEHAFIQVLVGNTGGATCHRFGVDGFWAARDSFDVRIGPNRFSSDGLELDILDERRPVAGRLDLIDPTPWPVSLTSLGMMGLYGWADLRQLSPFLGRLTTISVVNRPKNEVRLR